MLLQFGQRSETEERHLSSNPVYRDDREFIGRNGLWRA
jgi:hypothetical protein